MPEPLVVQVMRSHKAALIRQDAEQMAAMAAQWRRVEAALQDQVELFARRVAEDRLNPGQIQSRQFQLDRYQSLLNQVRTELDKYTNYADALITERQRTLGSTAIQQAGQAIRAVANGTKIGFDVLPIRAIENMVGLGGDGSPLRNLLVDSYGAAADGMLNALVRATATGQNPRVTARSMVRDGLSQSLNRMMTTARTEQMRVFRESSRMAYQASGVVSGYRRLATKDSRTCPACLMLDGELYELTETLREHPQGRCTLLPIVDGFKPVEWEKGQDWFRNQPPDTQRSILGKGRYDLWSKGQIDLDQLASIKRNDTWGDSPYPTSVGELRSLARPVTVREPEPVMPVDTTNNADVPTLAVGDTSGDLAIPSPLHRPSAATLKSATQIADLRIEQVAREYGVTTEKVESSIKAALDKVLQKSDLRIQFKSKYIDSLLEDGRFKTQFETGKSGGMLDTSVRANAENNGMGIPQDIDPTKRPIYGYVNADPEAFVHTAGYGNLSFVLKDTVKQRTSLTVGDSLAPFINQDVAATPITAPGKEAWDNRVRNLYQFARNKKTADFLNKISYLEIQIQNGASLDDVTAVVDRAGKLTAKQKKRFAELGIEVRNE